MAVLQFKKPTGVSKAKVLLIGDAGSGKTHFALTCPKPVVMDTEGGTDLFGDRFTDFVANHSRSYRDIMDTIKSYATGQMPGDTLVIDSITSIYNVLLATYPDDQFLKNPKRDFRRLIDFLYGRLPCHVVMTAWEKVEYAKPGEMIDDGSGGTKRVKAGELIPTGFKMECDQKALYAFDFVFRLWIDKKNKKRYATVMKSRSGAFKDGQVIENPSWAMLKDLVDKAPFVPRQTEEEAAESDLAAEKAPAASAPAPVATQPATQPAARPASQSAPTATVSATSAAAEPVKDGVFLPVTLNVETVTIGSNRHLNQLMARHNALAPKTLTTRQFLVAHGIVKDEQALPDQVQRLAAVSKIESEIARFSAPRNDVKAEKFGMPAHLAQ